MYFHNILGLTVRSFAFRLVLLGSVIVRPELTVIALLGSVTVLPELTSITVLAVAGAGGAGGVGGAGGGKGANGVLCDAGIGLLAKRCSIGLSCGPGTKYGFLSYLIGSTPFTSM